MSTQPTLNDRVAALEQRLATVGASEATLPTYLVVDPTTGDVTAQFTGSVLLNEATTEPFSPTNALSWQDALAIVREYIQGFRSGNFHSLVAASQADTANFTDLILASELLGGSGTSVATIQLGNTIDGPSAINIIDSKGQSSFVQNALPVKRIMAPSTSPQQSWPGGTANTSYAYTHGLAVPASAQYFAIYQDNGLVAAFCSIQNASTSGCTIAVSNPGGVVAGGTVFNLAILAILDY